MILKGSAITPPVNLLAVAASTERIRSNGGSVVVLLFLTLTASSCGRQPSTKAVPGGYLFEKEPYQAFYGPDGNITRLLYDGNGDKTADRVTLFYPTRTPRQTEIDTDFDGAVDRWQFFSSSGRLDREAFARRTPGVPDLWLYRDTAGALARRELDEDGDGVVERKEYFEGQNLTRIDVDSDGDGRIDRWQSWSADQLVLEQLDTDGDGVADRRLRYEPAGDAPALDYPGSAEPPRRGDRGPLTSPLPTWDVGRRRFEREHPPVRRRAPRP